MSRLIFTKDPAPRYLVAKTVAAAVGIYLLYVFALGA
jgi:hypothetical protein